MNLLNYVNGWKYTFVVRVACNSLWLNYIRLRFVFSRLWLVRRLACDSSVVLVMILDYIQNHLSYSLKKAMCYLSRSHKIDKTDEISEMKKFTIHSNKKRLSQSCRVNLWSHTDSSFFARMTTSTKGQLLVQFHKILCSNTSHYCMPLRSYFPSVSSLQ